MGGRRNGEARLAEEGQAKTGSNGYLPVFGNRAIVKWGDLLQTIPFLIEPKRTACTASRQTGNLQPATSNLQLATAATVATGNCPLCSLTCKINGKTAKHFGQLTTAAPASSFQFNGEGLGAFGYKGAQGKGAQKGGTHCCDPRSRGPFVYR